MFFSHLTHFGVFGRAFWPGLGLGVGRGGHGGGAYQCRPSSQGHTVNASSVGGKPRQCRLAHPGGPAWHTRKSNGFDFCDGSTCRATSIESMLRRVLRSSTRSIALPPEGKSQHQEVSPF